MATTVIKCGYRLLNHESHINEAFQPTGWLAGGMWEKHEKIHVSEQRITYFSFLPQFSFFCSSIAISVCRERQNESLKQAALTPQGFCQKNIVKSELS